MHNKHYGNKRNHKNCKAAFVHLGEDVASELLLVGDERIAVQSEERLLLPNVNVVPLVELIVTLLP